MPGLIPQLLVAPAVFGVFYLVCGVWVVAAPEFLGVSRLISWAVTMSAGAVVFVALPASRRYAFFLLVGAVLTGFHLFPPRLDYTDHLARREGGAAIRGVCIDPAYSADELKWLLEPTGVIVRVKAIRPAGARDWHPCRGKILLRTDEQLALPYGTRLVATGAFLARPEKVVEAEFDYGRYLRIRGVRRLFDAQELELDGLAGGVYWPMRIVYSLREVCAETLSRSLRSRETQAILLAMTLGYRRGLTGAVRRSFIRSGVVHVFAISGLHVGIAAALLGGVLQMMRLPYRFRFAMLPVLIGVYVLMTGAAPSAVRAWLMISIWCLARARLHPISPLNTVAAAALILLLVNPLMLFDQGFIFSFAVVGVLVLGWMMAAPVEGALGERWFWTPKALRGGWMPHCKRRLRMSAARLFMGSGLAWLGSAGLILGTQALLIPGSILVNAMTAILVWWVILLAGIKVVTGVTSGFLPFLDLWLGRVLNVLVTAMEGVVAFGQEFPMSVAVTKPGTGWVCAYYVILMSALVLAIPLRRRAVLMGVCVLVLLAATFQAGMTTEPAAAVFQGGNTAFPVIVAHESSRSAPVIMNTGSYWMGGRVGSWLAARGVDQADCLWLSGWGRDRAGGMFQLLQRVSVRTMVLPDAWTASPWLAEEVEAAFLNGVRIRTYDYPWRDGHGDRVTVSPWRFKVGRHLGNLNLEAMSQRSSVPDFHSQLIIDRFCGSEIQLQLGTGRRHEFYLPFQLRPSCYVFLTEEMPQTLDLGPASGIFEALSESGP